MNRFIHFLIIATSVILIGSLGSLFQSGIDVSLQLFIERIVMTVTSLFDFSQLTYESPAGSGIERSIFPFIFEYYGYSLFILLAGFCSALLAAFLLTYFTFFVSPSIREGIKKAVGLLEAIPDILIIVVVQLAFIALYRKTGILLFEVVGAFERPIILPLVTFAILPSLFLYRIMLLDFEEEWSRPYVELARGKGMTKGRILIKHIMRNSLVSLVNHSKSLILLLLTNLVMLEVIFNLYGITWFIITYISGQVVIFSVLIIFIPLYITEAFVRRIITHFTGEEVPR
ncbi:MAG: ABC transporter permease subunit [Anaerobacillus sp.]